MSIQMLKKKEIKKKEMMMNYVVVFVIAVKTEEKLVNQMMKPTKKITAKMKSLSVDSGSIVE
eukprot:CAMPEP_0114363278 /NCGR_PEP_ID=MMETSP0101-20121206/26442_1 /TAXON_ID=38822 ORGANISM="Pteridomonas danica, Strain PT" /NCGR_SAMPLE_ID=MMETSP0101 /ASSEMBLY_ACC=CAM_ASM_000211 /LENGTH=61 /DNA_ID=CAMNT_0001509831 /DNA_START=379 /DNA_END=564 /DNA_ORIENTATION=+